MNKRGFTLVELLTSIVILALILAIAIPSIGNLAKSIRESQRKNLISEIEIAASKYAFDTGETLVFVDKLVTDGYLDSDDEIGNIMDPANSNSRMNCYLVEMKKEGNYYKASFKDDNNYDNNGSCDLEKLNEYTEEIKIVVKNGSTVVSNSKNWIKGNNIVLSATSSTINIDCNVNDCNWYSSSGAFKTGESSISLNGQKGILDTKYTFQMTDYSNNNIKRYTASTNLKIDNEPPTIYQNEITITNRFIETSIKDVTIEASDGKGSGISGYYIGLKKTQATCTNSLVYNSSNKFIVNKKGTYIVCVKDNVGNISTYDNLIINYLPN